MDLQQQSGDAPDEAGLEPPIDPDAALVAFMRRRSVVCPACKSDLRNATSLNCPHCGVRLSLGIQAEAFPYSFANPDVALIEFMRHRDRACPSCRYNLRNLATPNCPECGIKLALRVRQASPFIWPWIASILALCFPSGLCLVFGYIFVSRWQFPDYLFWPRAYYVEATVLLSPLVLMLMLAFRRRFLLGSRGFQLFCMTVMIANDIVAFLWWLHLLH